MKNKLEYQEKPLYKKARKYKIKYFKQDGYILTPKTDDELQNEIEYRKRYFKNIAIYIKWTIGILAGIAAILSAIILVINNL